ncbi:2-C-methyl-D-erythritol 4-phosphate cytidylyltransferase [Sulfuricaulis sp.]|uniref:2-C-methyl-D-erythritol 4-phosphate cytidylyltransferase n=1 Tax=Sulfuricaulis sp. TaxID=2003553 RepID=UPI00345D421F
MWALIPAGGQGRRMNSSVPKQYLPLLGRPVILHTLERLCAHPCIQGVLVGVAPDDQDWQKMTPDLKRLSKFLGTSDGGASRAHTVLNGLKALAKHSKPDDWVLVHDAVRPCVRNGDIDKLISAVSEGEEGGLLAFPVTDTVKRVDNAGQVLETVKRDGLWRAATPQMFRINKLIPALEQAMKTGKNITDEASAIEAAGGHPRVVVCHTDNIKITLPEDLALAELYMKQQQGNA